ncbi:MAG: hypothetical protein AAB370_02540 [Verrucomicrobiota bacterium]
MIRVILFIVLLVFLVIGGLAVGLYQLWGWKGFLAFPFILIAMVWLIKLVVGKMFKHFALSLFGMKSGVLRGATMNVHSIRSVPKPVEAEVERASLGEGESDESADDDDEGEGDDATPDEPISPKDYVELDVTITPKQGNGGSVWEPTELMLTTGKIKSLSDLEGKEAGTTHSVEVWNGTAFGPDDPGKYPGEQRLKIIFAVKPGMGRVWLHYYNEPIGELQLPPGTIDV